MMKKYSISLFLIIILLAGCDKKGRAKFAANLEDSIEFYQEKESITIGTFNLEWLGDGKKDRLKRKKSDYKKLAQIIRDTDADILGLQEIENEKALKKLLKYLPEFHFIIGETGGPQKLAIIYKKYLTITHLGEYYPLMVEERRTRAGLWIYAKARNFDFYLMNVHFKSSSHWDNTPVKRARSIFIRTEQAKAAANWADSLIKNTEEEDIIIVGDFNDSPRRKKYKTLDALSDIMWFITKDLKSCKYRSAYVIDHVTVSDIAGERYLENSRFVSNLYSSYSKKELKKLSDHCPITVKFDIESQDNDPPNQYAVK